MINKFLLTIGFLFCFASFIGCSTNIPVRNFGGADSTSIPAGLPVVTNVTVFTNTVVIPADGTNNDWLMFSEDNNVRCLPQYYGSKTNVPSSSVGWLLIGNGVPLSNYPGTDPTYEWDCIAVSTTAHLSIISDKRK